MSNVCEDGGTCVGKPLTKIMLAITYVGIGILCVGGGVKCIKSGLNMESRVELLLFVKW